MRTRWPGRAIAAGCFLLAGAGRCRGCASGGPGRGDVRRWAGVQAVRIRDGWDRHFEYVGSGRPFAGARGNALIMASSPFTMECSSCGTALNPILEEFASGPALVERYNRHGSGTVERGEDVTAAAEEGDDAAVKVVRSAGEALGNSVGFLVNVMDPEAIVVGGGLGTADGLYWDSFVASTRAHIWAENSRGLPILPAAMGADSGLIGAAATVFQRPRSIHSQGLTSAGNYGSEDGSTGRHQFCNHAFRTRSQACE